MAEYIDKTKLIADGWVMSRTYQQDTHTMTFETKKIADIPSEDVAPVVHGRWRYRPNFVKTEIRKWPVAECDKCGMSFCDVINCMSAMYHYCPNCGATMDKEDT